MDMNNNTQVRLSGRNCIDLGIGLWKGLLGENCTLAANQSVDCRATILFTISLNSAKV